ncbi:hypothetical protein ACFQ23_04775 [Schaalia naturae]|uniref:Uncharacterized protein n=1 Tax=Schaalia naturae TaxID=635203 RepID=A0ABW2SPT4_9ACTO
MPQKRRPSHRHPSSTGCDSKLSERLTKLRSETWAERTGAVDVPGLGCDAVSRGAATAEELASMAGAWRRWGSDPDGWFVVVHGEVLARKEAGPGQEAWRRIAES